jgi:hypothetical protein
MHSTVTVPLMMALLSRNIVAIRGGGIGAGLTDHGT